MVEVSMTSQQIDQYFERIGYSGARVPCVELLCDLQEAHFVSIPYENMDILAGKRLSYDPQDLFDKIIVRKRGGYCFELNAIFGWLLTSLGFTVTHYFARFVADEPTIPKRRHRLLYVQVQGQEYIADVGVGMTVPRRSMLLVEHDIQTIGDISYRFIKEPFLGWVLHELHHDQWRKLYAFTQEEQIPVDFDAISYFCECAPESFFNKGAIIGLQTKDGRKTIDDMTFKIFSKGEVQVEEMTSQEQRDAILAEHFGIVLL